MALYPLRKMFDSIPRRYDLINRLFTLGLDRKWRAAAAGECLKNSPLLVLDLCCGTGDLAIEMAATAGKETMVAGLDFSEPMIQAAREKARRLGRTVSFIAGNAAALPFPDGSVGAAGMAFAFRNLTYKNPLRDRFLREVVRVLTPGGRLVVVESSQPKNRVIRWCFHRYLQFGVSFIGGMVSGDRKAYRYLAGSARYFHNPEEVESLLTSAGFTRVTWKRFFFGAAAIHIAEK